MDQKFIPLSVPNLKGKELEYVTHAVQTEWVSSVGAYVDSFETKTAEYVNAAGAISVQNGTSGLHVALQVCGVSAGDEVIVPTLTFIAAVNPVKYLSADPIFMDCDDSLCMDPVKLSDFCKEECIFTDGKLINKRTGKYIKAVLVVHVFGNLADMERITEIADEFNLKIIEDATEALGSYYSEGVLKGKFAGTIGTLGVYSFNGNKIITTGGGGMIVSNDKELLKKAKHLTTQAKSDDLYYTHDEIGYNYRMTNVQAAIGLAQLEQIETFIKQKQENYVAYQEGIRKIPGLQMLPFREDIRSNYWFYSLFISEDYPLNRENLIQYLNENKIQARPVWGLINEQKPYLSNQVYKIENAKKYWANVVNIPCSSNLTEEDVQYIINCLKSLGS
ncbi:LegC family aminotransferase [Robertmurraya korlensis]|uniref:LegC family aminotransferase n=1 Tax=Robertmurraya korlensis TaxID=519977 RepID=UPI000825B0E3|nr:LegC family aminotransferase [Robertmurraya korlensis]